jgi:hypothetical protein
MSLRTCESIHGWTDLFHPSVDGQSTQRTQRKERTSAFRPFASWRLCASYVVFSHVLTGGFRLQRSAPGTSLHSATPAGARDIEVEADCSDVARAACPDRSGQAAPATRCLRLSRSCLASAAPLSVPSSGVQKARNSPVKGLKGASLCPKRALFPLQNRFVFRNKLSTDPLFSITSWLRSYYFNIFFPFCVP